MKTVVSPDMVAHLWANRSQDTARNAGDTFYFRGSTIYSYGSHFPIASFSEGKRSTAVLMTTKGYSVTTAKHISMVRRALPSHVPVIYCHTPFRIDGQTTSDDMHKANRAAYTEDAITAATKAAKARLRSADYLADYNNTMHQAAQYSAHFGLGWKLEGSETVANALTASRKLVAQQKTRRTIAQRKAEAARALLEADSRKRYDKALAQWLQGDDVRLPYSNSAPVSLRVRGDDIQTSKGAVVPVAHAKRLWTALERVKGSTADWIPNGHTLHIGAFAVDRIEAITGDIHAGCHHIKHSEVARIAAQLGLTSD